MTYSFNQGERVESVMINNAFFNLESYISIPVLKELNLNEATTLELIKLSIELNKIHVSAGTSSNPYFIKDFATIVHAYISLHLPHLLKTS